jgi:dihydroorotate dehydrogenase electron transfer subunit
MSVSHPAHRGSILLEDAKVVAHEPWPGDQHVLTLHAPRIAARATAGCFVHLTCDEHLPMRRPLSVQRADPKAGTIEILYKIVGDGLARLARAVPGDQLSCMGPIGHGFEPDPARPLALLIGGGVGMPPMVFLAETMLARAAEGFRPLVLLGSEIPFPFRPRPSTIVLPGMPGGAIAAHPLLEDWGVASRLATLAGFAGCHAGYVTDLAAEWLGSLDTATLTRVSMYACGPTPMLAATARVARRFDLPCQVSLEEFMACAVGGCAGCAVEVATPAGPAMKRVCVDGPVFDSRAVFPAATP